MSRFTDRFETFLVRNRTNLLSFIRSMVGDDELAEDILQDSLLKTLQGAPEIDDEQELASWFYRIIRNAITDAYRRHAAAARRLERYAREQPEPIMTTEEKATLCKCFEDLLPTLKPEYAELIEAMDLGGLTTNEMTERLTAAASRALGGDVSVLRETRMLRLYL